jgi:hypothetical protein
MKRAFAAIPALLLLALIIPPVPAAGITLSAAQQDYYFLTGQRVEIPLAVTSTFPGEVTGIIRFSTDTQLQKTGTIMISTENRVFSHAVPEGPSFLNLTMSPSPVSRDYKVHVSYYYQDPAPFNASLPEIYVHIVADPGLVKNIPVQRAGTTLPENGEIPLVSSVSMTEQTVSVREQMGSDSSRGSSLSGARSPAGTADPGQQQRDREEREREQAVFDARLAADPLFTTVNASLVAEGFSRQSLDTQPAGNDTGTFSVLYRRSAGDQVVVQGSMEDGVVPYVRERANVPVTADPALDANATFRSFALTLAAQEYLHGETAVNRTLDGAMANITYATTSGNRAYVNATVGEGLVTQVSLEREAGPAVFPPFPVLMAAAGILAISVWWIYRRKNTGGLSEQGTGPAVPVPVFDHRAEAERILTDAELAFARQEYVSAYRLAGRALRIFLSHEAGDKSEMTVPEIVAILRKAGRDTAEVELVLGQCSEVAFAKGTPDPGDFSRITGWIRKIFQS